MRSLIFRLFVLFLGIILVTSPAEAQKKRRGDRDKLTRVELDEAGGSIVTARDAVRILRPQWLTPAMGRMAYTGADGTGGTSDAAAGSSNNTIGAGTLAVVLYIDDVRQPDLEALSTVPAAKLVELRFLDSNRAVMLRGPGHERGVIEIITTDKRK